VADIPGQVVLALIVRNTRAECHRAIANILVRENGTRKENFAELIVSNKNRDFWKEVNKINSSK